jgi:aspartate kinase
MMNVKVFKFGGASVDSAERVRNVAAIVRQYPGQSLMLVISAIGKTTNALEQLLRVHMGGDAVGVAEHFFGIRDYHLGIVHDLFTDKDHPVFAATEGLFEQLRTTLKKGPSAPFDEEYDRVVSFGELLSSQILHHYLNSEGLKVALFDARNLIRTDSAFRDAKVDWAKTQVLMQKQLFTYFQEARGRIALTQGFIAGEASGKTTTLGREGSDFTAAIIAYAMRTKEVTIWKDVPGVLNADPKWFENPVKLDVLSFREAIELAYYGASIIHPKTIKPLENANITLYVKSFLAPGEAGTKIMNLKEWSIGAPVFIRKLNQVLISVSPRDFSFIVEENLSQIFNILARHKVRANVMQNSAISFSITADQDEHRIPPLINDLNFTYSVRYNEGLELYTIRHYDQAAIDRISGGKTILLEQKTRHTVHLVLRPGKAG